MNTEQILAHEEPAWFTLQVTNHPLGWGAPKAETDALWKTVYEGPIATSDEARATVDSLARLYRSARALRGRSPGTLWYAVLDGRDFAV